MAFVGRQITPLVILVLTFVTSALKAVLPEYTNSWAVHLPEADNEKANLVAERHGMVNLGQVGTLEGFYHFKHLSHPRRMKRELIHHTTRLSAASEVKWVEQQIVKRRVKRDFSDPVSTIFGDPDWSKQWYLHNNGFDHNVIPVWKELNITGRGVSVSILDDGIEKDHPDLKANYDPEASFDFNSHDSDPSPRQTFNNENRHGTRCAGEVASVAGNSVCGVGVAYGAKVGGIRMLDGDVTDVVEGYSLSFKPLHIDIYSASWGPDDDGATVDGPGVLAKKAFSDGIKKGRGGLGNIFVWASGNGGRESDNCNCDGYTNNIFTLSISSATDVGTVPWYSESCASTLASTFSSGSWKMKKIVTTDLHHRCTESHTGTSASAPLAAGILALALEANPKLTWRDMQHIVVRTSRTEKLVSSDWVTNGVGRKVSHRFGYGLLDAKALVETALKWKTVPKKHLCREPADTKVRTIPAKGSLVVTKLTSGCAGTENYVRYLEHLEVVISLSVPKRGALSIYVTSPQGTRSQILGKRSHDGSSNGFKGWEFMSTHTWEENPNGTWTLELQYDGFSTVGSLKSLQFRFHGTQQPPNAGYENCASECKNGCHGPKASDCTECAHYKADGVCVKHCPAETYADLTTKRCLVCHNLCLECSGPAPDQCTACPSSRVLYASKCIEECPARWFANKTKHCAPCNKQCLSCDTEANNCTSCKEDHKLVSHKCVISCRTNDYVQNDRCQPCHPSCAKCKNSTAWSCTQCATTTITRESVTQDVYLHMGMCMIRCPPGFYGAKHQCLPCHASCKYCTGLSETECTSCKDGLVMVTNASTLCLDSCPTGYSHKISENSCQKCASSCAACDPNRVTKCTACGNGLFLWEQRCVDICPNATYPSPVSHKCEYCHPSCATCGTMPTQCTRCSSNLFLYGNKCVAACPIGTYTYGKNSSCLPCDSKCSDCFGSGGNQCLHCALGWYFLETKCVEKCPQGMFAEKSTGGCRRCSISCEGCLENATNCKECKAGLQKVNGLCQPVCDPGTFLNGTTAVSSNNSSTLSQTINHCSKCHSSCLTCSGPTQYDCLRCIGVKFHNPKTNLCSAECPAQGFYAEIDSSHCKPCPSQCLACSDGATCTKCVPGLALYDKKCVSVCPEGFYFERPCNTCRKCDAKCKDCSGSPSTCVSCEQPKILLHSRCVAECPSRMFLSASFQRCLPCDSTCETCVGPGQTHCTSCLKPLVLFQAQCHTVCPGRYYYNPAANQCQPCDYYCEKCNGGNGLSNCSACREQFVLQNNMCVRKCSPGFVLNQSERRCIPCHKSCSTCLGPSQFECLSCSDVTASLAGSVCKHGCGIGEYRAPDSTYCEKCHPSCKTCTGAGAHACSSCFEGRHLRLSQCISVCKDDEYRNHGACYMCSSSCKTCRGPSSTDCLGCAENHELYNMTCVERCPPKTYRDESNGLVECHWCHSSCATCAGRAVDQCTSCRVDLYLKDTSCVKQCPINYQLDENTRTCKFCDGSCPGFANLTDRSASDSANDIHKHAGKVKNPYFALIAIATAVTLLALFALYGLLKGRSTTGYTRVDENTTATTNTDPVVNNNVPAVYVHDNMERQPMLNYEESGL